jgi:hypothetical protein
MLLLCVYVPETHLEAVKDALFAAGAGKIGHYERCAWQCEGQGQFRPLKGSSPFLGQGNQIETVREWKLELVLERGLGPQVLEALKKSHPYETPAFHLLPIMQDCP